MRAARLRVGRLRVGRLRVAAGSNAWIPARGRPRWRRLLNFVLRRLLRQCEQLIESELTPLQRRIFHLKHLRRQSTRTIAGALDKSEDAIKANLYRMRRAIAEAAPGLEQILQA